MVNYQKLGELIFELQLKYGSDNVNFKEYFFNPDIIQIQIKWDEYSFNYYNFKELEGIINKYGFSLDSWEIPSIENQLVIAIHISER